MAAKENLRVLGFTLGAALFFSTLLLGSFFVVIVLINQMENQPEDPHELYLQIREKLNEMRAFGMPLPEDLVAFEKDLEAQFAATKRDAKKD